MQVIIIDQINYFSFKFDRLQASDLSNSKFTFPMYSQT